jgi:hypothetical protein
MFQVAVAVSARRTVAIVTVNHAEHFMSACPRYAMHDLS